MNLEGQTMETPMKSARIPAVVAVVLSVSLATACQTVNYATARTAPQEALLVIPLEFTIDPGEAASVFSLNLAGVQDPKTADLVDFSQTFAFIRDIAPGVHRFMRILVRWKLASQIVTQRECDIPFELKPGTARLPPVRFSLTVKDRGAYFTSCNLLASDVEAARGELKTRRRIETRVMG